MADFTGISVWVTALAGLSSLALAGLALTPRPRTRLHWSFAAGMLAFAVESGAVLALLAAPPLPGTALGWLRLREVTGLLVPIPWLIFIGALASARARSLRLAWRLGLGAGVLALAVLAVGALTGPLFELSVIPGPFEGAPLVGWGPYVVVGQLLEAVAVLAGLELCLRTSASTARWRIKYLVVGLGGVFLIRFYLASQVLLFHTLLPVYLTTAAATLFVGNLVIGVALARDRFRNVELRVSPTLVYRSVVVGVLGVYLSVVGGLGWVLNRLAIGQEIFWGSIVVFVLAIGLAAALLSESVRWRIRRFIGLHFYRSKYDYRLQWGTFTTRLGSLLSIEELAAQLLSGVTQAVGTNRAVLYLANGRDGYYSLAGEVEVERAERDVARDLPLIQALVAQTAPLILEGGEAETARRALPPVLAETFGEGSVAVPLPWRDTLPGFMLLGPERTGLAYSPEDVEFLTTVAEQAAGAIVTAKLSETLAQAREFEAFHRLTSFVIHDLKNSITALSLLSQNALEHFDDPEFQRDALRTLSRTTDRMKALLTRLSGPAEANALRREPVDLPALVAEAAAPIARGRVTLVKELGPVAAVDGDAEALLRVVQNLLTNAVQAMPSSGGLVTLKTYEEPSWVVLSVTDTGCGISEQFLRHSLFAPFRSTKKGGWGIGLYQARAIVEAHGGRIEVSSKEGAGTTFWIRLPVLPPAARESA